MIELFPQGWEEIPYDPIEGDTSVDYYLMANLEGDQVVDPHETIAFGYSSEHNVYFTLYEEEYLKQLGTRKQVDEYVVASVHAADAEYTIALDDLLTYPFKEVWLTFHRKHYRWMYE